MSDPYAIIVLMEKWYKYSYICPICDALIEITNRTNIYSPQMCCGETATWLSVVDATIVPTQQKEEQNMETTTETLPQVMKLDWLENDVVTTKEYTESDIRHLVWQAKNLSVKQSEWYRKESELSDLIHEVYADSNDQESLAQIAEMFDISLTKEVEFTAWVRVDLTIEVDLSGDFDNIDELVSQNLTIDSYGSEISVNNYEVDRVEEGAY